MRNAARWWLTMGAFCAFMLCGFGALVGVVTGNWMAALLPGVVAVVAWRYLRKLPTFTPRPGGPGSDF